MSKSRRVEVRERYIEGWYQLDAELLLSATAPEFTFDDPAEPGQFADWQLGINFSVPLGLRAERSQLRRQELIIARDQRSGYDHAIRASGAVLVEVGFNEIVSNAGEDASVIQTALYGSGPPERRERRVRE